ncbi:endonuclease/exonuclease/phosphatase family protein [Paraferrimonas sedimenticola]|uniref:Hydrolase n=1 Tax=Paraferrimonas sedimenticola TaxID=375674 RepID=A0AA37W0H6_9GAMM|nr:endonuclease/exonuclease/phosphatase family protein [Paraferrimonas sedimenticola]GLP95037.1 hydrolase [Paraferrimonas sedimenticola]
MSPSRVSLLAMMAATSLLSACAPSANPPVKSPDALRLVTWNIEHLAEFDGKGCLPRQESDYAKLREFAAGLNADVVALQEVENAAAVARVFPADKWDVLMSERADTESYECRGAEGQMSTQQKVGFAVRKGLDYSYQADDNLSELGIGNPGLRHGVVLTVRNGQQQIDLMSVHMKSGCFVKDYRADDKPACVTLAQQVPVLERWMQSRLDQGTPFVILGDFNHNLGRDGNQLWSQLSSVSINGQRLANLSGDILGCHPKYPHPIDHVLGNSGLLEQVVEGSSYSHGFGYAQGHLKQEDMLSDHCPVSVDIRW